MAIRKQISVSSDTQELLKALEFCTKRNSDSLVAEGLRALMAGNPGLAAKVDQARKAAA